MNKERIKKMTVLRHEEIVKTFGGYAPPEGWGNGVLNPPTNPKPLDPKDLVCWKKIVRECDSQMRAND